jgi:hypothetical protein
LRNAYVVYDLVNNRIGLAQSNINSTTSNVIAFSSVGAPIPSATTPVDEVTSVASTNTTANPKAPVAGLQTALPSGFTLTYKPVLTSLSAASGFAVAAATNGTGSALTGTSTASSTASGIATISGNSAAVAMLQPLDFMAIRVMATTMICVFLGFGIFSWLE